MASSILNKLQPVVALDLLGIKRFTMSRKPWKGKIALLAAAAVGLVACRRASQSRFSFAGNTVLITGGSRGLGLILARKFADEGASLAILARHEEQLRRAEKELKSRTPAVLAFPCDIRDRRQAEEAIERVRSHYGRLDVLVNNAGIIQVGPFENMTLEDYKDAIATYILGPLYLTLAAVPHMRRQGGGRQN